ncbi:response regulator transcription factor [Undibacterium sp. Ji49W]|uniref:response regulator transcription factor n=1 Tax=Undibacterium sp. Ji49W TaxID=3413040 RepID=UPI003BF30F47
MRNNNAWVAIVDDEEGIRRALLRLFRSVGLEAHAFHSGENFLSSLEKSAPSCIVMDLNMPEMSGFALLEQLRIFAPGLPVVILTAHEIRGTRQELSLPGIIDVLQKPATDSALLGAIAKSAKQLNKIITTHMKEN